MDFWRNVALGDVNFADVDEIIDIKIDRRKSSDPYIFKEKGNLVRIRFSDIDKTVEVYLANVLKNYIVKG